MNVLLIDANHISSQGLIQIIQASGHLKLVSHIQDIGSADLSKAKNTYDILIYHHTNPAVREFEFLKKTHSEPKTKVLAILPMDEPAIIQSFWKMGTQSIVTTHCSAEELSTALDMLANNQRFYCNRILEVVTQQDEQADNLTERETEVLRQLAKGQTTQQIADSLFVSVHTINSHRKNIMKKLGFSSPVEMIVYAVKNNLIG